MPTEASKADAGRLRLSGLLAAIAGIYISQTLIYTIAMQSIPALMRQAGASLQWVSLSAVFMLPWAVKFLWAPAIERWRLPAAVAQRRSRPLILSGQLLLTGCLLLVALLGLTDRLTLQADGGWLLLALLAAATIAATVDIACDGFAVDQLASAKRGWGNVAQVGGGYIGVMLGGSGFVLLASRHGWAAALAAACAVILLLTLPMLWMREPVRAPERAGRHRPSLGHALRRPEVRAGVALTFMLGAGVRTATIMIGPLLLDKGATLEQLGWLFGGFSIGAGLIGTAMGGFLVRYAPGWRAVWVAVIVQAGTLALLGLAASTASLELLVVLSGLKFTSMACGFVAIYSALMGLSSPLQPGVDFTLFQCADALIAMVGGLAGGWLAQHWGYSTCFGVAASMAGGAALLVWRLERTAPAWLALTRA